MFKLLITTERGYASREFASTVADFASIEAAETAFESIDKLPRTCKTINHSAVRLYVPPVVEKEKDLNMAPTEHMPDLHQQIDDRQRMNTAGAFGSTGACLFPPPGPVDPELARLLQEISKPGIRLEPLEEAPEEERIFVVLAEYALGHEGAFKQPMGRLGAQIGHVVSKMRWSEGCRRLRKYQREGLDGTLKEELHRPLKPITTINLLARNQTELLHITTLLAKAGLNYEGFIDENPEYANGRSLTAICTEPIEKSKLGGITDYLPLWTPEETQ